jgi:hypothetical protein
MACILRKFCWPLRPEIEPDEDPTPPVEECTKDTVPVYRSIPCRSCRYMLHPSGICSRCVQANLDPGSMDHTIASPRIHQLDIGKVLFLELGWEVASSTELAVVEDHRTFVSQEKTPHVMSFGVICRGVDIEGVRTGTQYFIVFDLRCIAAHTDQAVTVLRDGDRVAQLLSWSDYGTLPDVVDINAGVPSADDVRFNI